MATRRRFIRDCSTFAVSAAFAPALTSAASSGFREVSLASVPMAELAGLLGSVFVASSPFGPQGLELVTVEPRPGDGEARFGPSREGSRWEAFSLCFRGNPGQPLAQDTYRFEHALLGRFEMFIVPVDRPDANGCCYEAVFHRPAPGPIAASSGLALRAGPPPRGEST